jgi:hypothetical protein
MSASSCCQVTGQVLPLIVSLPVAASSTLVIVFTAEVKVVMPPKASVVVAVTRTFWPTRDCVDVSSR